MNERRVTFRDDACNGGENIIIRNPLRDRKNVPSVDFANVEGNHLELRIIARDTIVELEEEEILDKDVRENNRVKSKVAHRLLGALLWLLFCGILFLTLGRPLMSDSPSASGAAIFMCGASTTPLTLRSKKGNILLLIFVTFSIVTAIAASLRTASSGGQDKTEENDPCFFLKENALCGDTYPGEVAIARAFDDAGYSLQSIEDNMETTRFLSGSLYKLNPASARHIPDIISLMQESTFCPIVFNACDIHCEPQQCSKSVYISSALRGNIVKAIDQVFELSEGNMEDVPVQIFDMPNIREALNFTMLYLEQVIDFIDRRENLTFECPTHMSGEMGCKRPSIVKASVKRATTFWSSRSFSHRYHPCVFLGALVSSHGKWSYQVQEDLPDSSFA